MRKQDYATLARILRDSITIHGENSPAASIARRLAEHLHVDESKFLEACGLKP